MGKLAKILSPLVAVLAIAAAVFSFLIYSGLKPYQTRAAKMAQGLSETAKKLDAGTNTGKSGKLDYKAPQPGVKEGGAFSYVKYKENPTDFEKNVNEVGAIASTVITQRNELADTVASVSKNLGASEESMPEDELKASSTYAGKLSLAVSYSKAVREREIDVLKGIQLIAGKLNVRGADVLGSTIEIETDADDVMTAKYSGSKGIFDKMGKSADELIESRNTYQKWLKSLNSYVRNYSWNARTETLSPGNARNVLDAAKKDLEGINSKLAELKRVKEELAEKMSELKSREEEIAKLKEDSEKLLADLNTAREKLRVAGVDSGDSRPPLKPGDPINQKIVGRVLLDNVEWNYIICDLSNRDVLEGIPVIVSTSDGKFLASGKISIVEDRISLVEIIRRSSASIAPGSKIYIGDLEDGNTSGDSDED